MIFVKSVVLSELNFVFVGSICWEFQFYLIFDFTQIFRNNHAMSLVFIPLYSWVCFSMALQCFTFL